MWAAHTERTIYADDVENPRKPIAICIGFVKKIRFFVLIDAQEKTRRKIDTSESEYSMYNKYKIVNSHAQRPAFHAKAIDIK